MSKDELLRAFVDAYEKFIETAIKAAQRGTTGQRGAWGPREATAHLAGWEIMATVRIPHVVAGMPPIEEADAARQAVMNDALNAAFVTLIGDQPLDTICGTLRQAYQSNIDMLQNLDDAFFRPGEYVYERTRSVIEHCQEHSEGLISN